MSNFLNNLTSRMDANPEIRPRIRGRFESTPAMILPITSRLDEAEEIESDSTGSPGPPTTSFQPVDAAPPVNVPERQVSAISPVIPDNPTRPVTTGKHDSNSANKIGESESGKAPWLLPNSAANPAGKNDEPANNQMQPDRTEPGKSTNPPINQPARNEAFAEQFRTRKETTVIKELNTVNSRIIERLVERVPEVAGPQPAFLPETHAKPATRPDHSPPIEKQPTRSTLVQTAVPQVYPEKSVQQRVQADRTVNITIGRVEVRAVGKSVSQKSPSTNGQKQSSVMSLSDYIARRAAGRIA